MMRRTPLLAVVFALSIPAWAHTQASASVNARIARIENGLRPGPVLRGGSPTTIEERMRALRVPAISIAVVDSGRIVWAKAYGVADVSTGQAATEATRFQAGSISKPVASVAALRLVERGKLSLDSDINSALRSWKIPEHTLSSATPVTLRMLLAHTAGLTVHGFPGYAVGAPVPTVPQILDGVPPANTAPVRINVKPGTLWRYSGGGMTVAQLAMSDVTGESFPALVRRLVLAPMKMTSSGYEQPLPDSVRASAASAHKGNGTVLSGRANTYPEMMAAGLWTTASDLGRFIIEVQRANDGKSPVLQQSTARAMLTPGLGNWGLGIQMAGAGDSVRFTHGGVNDGFQGKFIGYVTGGRGVAVLTNSDMGLRLADEVIAAIGREYNWPGLRELKEHAEITIDAKLLAGYVGRYQLNPNVVIAITQSGNQLLVQATGQPSFPIFPEGNTAFFAKIGEVEIHFETDAQGKATAIRLVQSGGSIRAPRVE